MQLKDRLVFDELGGLGIGRLNRLIRLCKQPRRIHLRILLCMKRSVIAAIAVLVLALLSMGALGAGFYYAAYPALFPAFGDLGRWSGSGSWPATIMAGMFWSPSFLVAGYLNLRLESAGSAPIYRRFVYTAILWAGAVCAWWASLGLSGNPASLP